MDTNTWIWIIVAAVVALIVGIVIGNPIGAKRQKKKDKETIGTAEDKAKTIVNDALKLAETKKKEAILEAKEEIHKNRNEAEREIRERRNEVQKMEKRIIQKEDALDKRAESMEHKENILAGKIKEAEDRLDEIDKEKDAQRAMLERISGMSVEQAKDHLLSSLNDDLKHEKALMIKETEERTKEEAENTAKKLISLAIQKCASDHVSETTVSVVALPNDEMKGRIIGREGRNIRALENLTGVDIIIDDTPER